MATSLCLRVEVSCRGWVDAASHDARQGRGGAGGGKERQGIVEERANDLFERRLL